MEIIKGFLTNTALICGVVSWFFAQFLKMLIEIFTKPRLRTKDFMLRALFGTGGMPSSHSSTISAVCVSIGFSEGFNSPLFALSFTILMIVVRDATGVRLSSGKQAAIINELTNEVNNNLNTAIKTVKEVRGHTPLETFVGVLVGILVSLGMNLI